MLLVWSWLLSSSPSVSSVVVLGLVIRVVKVSIMVSTQVVYPCMVIGHPRGYLNSFSLADGLLYSRVLLQPIVQPPKG